MSDTTPWLDEDQLRDWKSLVALVMTLPAELDAQLKRDTGLNMFEYHVLAAPVRDVTKAADAAWSEKYMGFLDMVSIVTYMLEKLQPGSAPEDFEAEAEKVLEFKSTTVGDIMTAITDGAFDGAAYDAAYPERLRRTIY